jgi:DNA polymerase V
MTRKIFALIDCNNFFASCERVFNPKLENKPVVVLSNNDGNIIARSNEVKAMGIPMGAVYFKFDQICRDNKIAVFSSNYALYGDMSNRVMCTLRKFSPDVEVYSIDEAFMRLDMLKENDLVAFCKNLRATIKQWTGIPVTIGIGYSKTLAKIANHHAKKNKLEVFDIRDEQLRTNILSNMNVEDIWGIGRRLKVRLNVVGIYKALQLREADPKFIRKQFGVVGEKTVYELRGLACMELEVVPPARKNIVSAKSFCRMLTKLEEVEEALSHYTAMTCMKMRAQRSKVHGINVFIETNYYTDMLNFYHNSSSYYFDLATSDTRQIITYAKRCLSKIFIQGHMYKKVGIMLLDLVDEDYNQGSLLSEAKLEVKSSQVMSLLDNVNAKMGRNTLFFAAQGAERTWQTRAAFKSNNYTGDWNQLIEIK